ncbi:MAG: NADP-dependent isocitrate dehydrogenase, partial [Proteobacteria bacterium]|nr:NADP-dependent isocitrate dehydrogenase [Pseudomonadota bacterium]
LTAAGARLQLEPIEIGEQVYRSGHSAGIAPESWESLRRTQVFYKAPITTPQGGGFKSLNVTIRKSLGLYANVRPCVAYTPFIATAHPGTDIVIIRENEEDLYAGIEHRQTNDVYQCLKLITRPGTEKIVRYAFDYARAHGRQKVTCLTKDNIMKLTDGLFHSVFDELAAEYPEIETDHLIIDIGAARLASVPEQFDVVVAPNLYGDIVSDIVAEITGSIGLAGSANIGEHCAMFEAIHGSAPDLAGNGVANPSGLLLAGVQMLVHIGQPEIASRVHNAWLKTIEDGIHTFDIYDPEQSKTKVGTEAFADAIIERLGEVPEKFRPAAYKQIAPATAPAKTQKRRVETKALVGIDVFLDWAEGVPEDIAKAMTAAVPEELRAKLELTMITNRGVKVWPNGFPETFCTDHWRVRYLAEDNESLSNIEIAALLNGVAGAGLDFIKTEGLYTFDGKPGFSLGQGQ